MFEIITVFLVKVTSHLLRGKKLRKYVRAFLDFLYKIIYLLNRVSKLQIVFTAVFSR